MDIDFIDIKIIGLEEELTVPSPNYPHLSYIYFRLSQTPPPLWNRHFKESRKIARSLRWRNIWVDRRYLLIMECAPDEIEAQLEELKKDLAFANSQYRAYLKLQTASEQHKANLHLQQRDKLREIKDRLNFD